MKFQLIVALSLFFFTLNAKGVVVANPSPTNPQNSPPANGAPWDNVLRTNGTASGIYLGGGWVLTAEHVYDDSAGNPASVVSAGITYFQDPSYGFILNNPTAAVSAGLSTKADLALFRLTSEIPSLTTIQLGDVSTNTSITMIGFGGGKSWGTNTVEGPPLLQNLDFPPEQNNNDAVVFRSDYDLGATTEAQAVSGDSGGAAFYQQGQNWLLGGVMIAVATTPDPDLTYFADLGTYSDQISAIISANGSVPEPSSCLLVSIASLGLFLRHRR